MGLDAAVGAAPCSGHAKPRPTAAAADGAEATRARHWWRRFGCTVVAVPLASMAPKMQSYQRILDTAVVGVGVGVGAGVGVGVLVEWWEPEERPSWPLCGGSAVGDGHRRRPPPGPAQPPPWEVPLALGQQQQWREWLWRCHPLPPLLLLPLPPVLDCSPRHHHHQYRHERSGRNGDATADSSARPCCCRHRCRHQLRWLWCWC